MYAALLESTGTAIIAHCVSQWLVMRDIPAETVAKISMDPSGVQDSGESSPYNYKRRGEIVFFAMQLLL